MKVISIIKYLFTFLGLAMLAGTYYINEDTRSYIAEATKTEGTVVYAAPEAPVAGQAFRHVHRQTTPSPLFAATVIKDPFVGAILIVDFARS